MKSVGTLKSLWQENREDFLFLLFAGAPFGVFCAFISQFLSLGEIY